MRALKMVVGMAAGILMCFSSIQESEFVTGKYKVPHGLNKREKEKLVKILEKSL